MPTGKPLSTLYVQNPTEALQVANKQYVDAAGGGSLGDLEFLRGKQVAGDLIIAAGNTAAAATTDVVTVTPAAGKTFFIADYNSIIENSTGGAISAQVNLKNDGTIKDSRSCTILLTVSFQTGVATIRGDSLVGDGAKVYKIDKTEGGASVEVWSTITGWIEDT